MKHTYTDKEIWEQERSKLPCTDDSLNHTMYNDKLIALWNNEHNYGWIEVESFKEFIKRKWETVKKLRDGKRVILFQNGIYVRYRLNPSEKRVFFIIEVSLDKKNWVIQNKFFNLRDVMSYYYKSIYVY